MEYNYLTQDKILHFIDEAIREDIGEGDHSTLASVPPGIIQKARLLVKDEGILAGVELALHIFRRIDPGLEVEVFIQDGSAIKKGEVPFHVSGDAQSILQAERLVLNCMQRMSGIATYTHQLNEMIRHTSAKLLDTRKTTPNFRLPEKWAVKIGGGVNHRYALYDKIMLKDNHIAFAGGISQALGKTHQYLTQTGKKLEIEIETSSLAQVSEVLAIGGVNVIMLDNMSIETMKEAVRLIGGRYKVEASGGITEESIAGIAETGVDYISVGALTHSVKSLDLSLKAF